MYGDTDYFGVYCLTLYAGIIVYTVVSLGLTAVQTAALLRGDEPRRRLLRTYLLYLLVSVRLRPLACELAQIVLLTAALAGLWWLHGALR